MSALNLRSIVTDALRDPESGLDLTKYAVGGYPGDVPQRPLKRTVSVWPVTLAPLPQLPSSYRLEVTVLVLSPHQDPAKADDDLDEALGDVLDVLWATNGLQFETASRQSYGAESKTVQAWALTFAAVITATEE